MMKSLRKKFSLIYLCLVIMIAFVGSVSVFSFYGLTQTIDGLMTDNYNSLKIINNMIEALERQDSAILTYTSGNHELGSKTFNSNIDEFLMWYYKEQNNITEVGERELVDQIKEHYMIYIDSFNTLTKMSGDKSHGQMMEYYASSIQPTFFKLKDEIRSLWNINEAAMFRGKTRTTKNAQSSTYLILVISLNAAVGGYFISRFFANKFTKPVEQLTESMKKIQAGNLGTRIAMVSDDEIGQLSLEFNKMTERLLLFEQSTLGKVITEKNKSLAIVKSISDPLMVLDSNYKIILVNKAFESFFQTQEDAAFKKHFLEIVKISELYDYIASVLNGSNVQHTENIFYLEYGNNHYYFNIIITKVKDTESRMNGVVVLFQNVTELKQLERMKTNFISTISHEFKTPLTSIMMGTSLLTDCTIGELNLAQKNILSSMEEDCQALTNLVNDLLHLSKLESTKYIYNMEPINLVILLENIIKPFCCQAENKEVDLYFCVMEDLPMVYADQERVSWVLNNLIVNALKYTREGDEISIQTHAEDGKVYISVEDTGIGIPEEYIDRIFEKFVQVENSDLEIRGTGLGLFIAREIVTAHGGEIWCESALDEGSRFTFTLPIYSSNFQEKEEELNGR